MLLWTGLLRIAHAHTINHGSTRLKRQSVRLKEYYCSFVTSSGTSKGTRYPMHNYLSCKRLSSSQTDYLDKISTTCEPSSFQQANQDPTWVHAMNQELAALELNETWDLVSRPSSRKVIGFRWVFKVKHNFDNQIERIKVRLVAKGHTQVESFDYTKTFSPVAKITSI